MQELDKIRNKIQELIKKDDFYHNINPSYLRDAVCLYPFNIGKAIRPALALFSYQAFGGSSDEIYNLCCACEIFHTWTLVHDDIIDEDQVRRNQPTTHIFLKNYSQEKWNLLEEDAFSFGNKIAILAGDLQQAWAMNFINKSNIPSDKKQLICQEMLKSLYPKLLAGETYDIAFEYRNFSQIENDEILLMIEYKTAQLLQFCAESGALLALNGTYQTKEVKTIGKFALYCGLAFQLQDDYLALFADQDKLGKRVGNDISQNKITFIMKKTLENCTKKESDFIHSIFIKQTCSNEELSKIQEIIIKSDTLNQYQKLAQDYIDKACNLLDKIENNNKLQQLAELMLYRAK